MLGINSSKGSKPHEVQRKYSLTLKISHLGLCVNTMLPAQNTNEIHHFLTLIRCHLNFYGVIIN